MMFEYLAAKSKSWGNTLKKKSTLATNATFKGIICHGRLFVHLLCFAPECASRQFLGGTQLQIKREKKSR